jgi:hypothetical protein
LQDHFFNFFEPQVGLLVVDLARPRVISTIDGIEQLIDAFQVGGQCRANILDQEVILPCAKASACSELAGSKLLIRYSREKQVMAVLWSNRRLPITRGSIK